MLTCWTLNTYSHILAPYMYKNKIQSNTITGSPCKKLWILKDNSRKNSLNYFLFALSLLAIKMKDSKN